MLFGLGESLPQGCLDKCNERSKFCDIMIIAGTSLVVSPANTLPAFAKQNNAILIEINPEETVMSNEMDVSIRNTSSNILPQLIEFVKTQKS